MKLLWLCNNAPGVVRSAISGQPASAVNWMDQVLDGLRKAGIQVRILYRGVGEPGTLPDGCSYRAFGEEAPWVYRPELEAMFREEIRTFQPDVIHSWGVEYDHALAMANAAREEGKLVCTVASIQGLCRFLAEHYLDGIPQKVQRQTTFRDFVRKDNLLRQQEKFVLRGKLETQTVQTLKHIIGRTTWDKEKTAIMNPNRQYHFCNETLRAPFYEGQWRYGECKQHRVFASSCSYPIKGFHILLEAMAIVRETYPDATLAVTGRSFAPGDWKGRLRRGTYEVYLDKLARKYQLPIVFLGNLSAEEMKRAYLDANVFCLPSTMENSPNALGEAMLLGVPCVAADVGGVRDLLEAGREGRIYPPGDVQALAKHICELFAMEDQAAALGEAARSHAAVTHAPQKNLKDLLAIYESLRKENQ